MERGSSAKDESKIHTIIRRGIAEGRIGKLDDKISAKLESALKKEAGVKKELDSEISVLSSKVKSEASEVRQFKPQQPKKFFFFPKLSEHENPIRHLRVDEGLFDAFRRMKAAIVEEVAKDNADIQRASYEWCMECWLQEMYYKNEENKNLPPIEEYRQFIIVANADKLLFAQDVGRCTNCDHSKPIGLGEQVMWNNGYKQ